MKSKRYPYPREIVPTKGEGVLEGGRVLLLHKTTIVAQNLHSMYPATAAYGTYSRSFEGDVLRSDLNRYHLHV